MAERKLRRHALAEVKTNIRSTPLVIQFIKFDEREQKINKLVWADQTASPMELIEAVWKEVHDFREHYELPDGLYRQHIPAFDEIMVRELLVDALVHRPYTQRCVILSTRHCCRGSIFRLQRR